MLHRNGAVGFIDWLDALRGIGLMKVRNEDSHSTDQT